MIDVLVNRPRVLWKCGWN